MRDLSVRGGTRGFSGDRSYVPAIICLQECIAAEKHPLLHAAIHPVAQAPARGGSEGQIPQPRSCTPVGCSAIFLLLQVYSIIVNPAGVSAMTVIAVCNQKGGSGKTTMAINLAAAFAADDMAVLLVDLDPQGSVVDWNSIRACSADDLRGGGG